MNDIFSLSANHNDYEIMDTLKIPNQTYYRIKTKMYREARRIWQQVCKESLEYRALHMINSINLALKVNQEIAIDPNQPAKERLRSSTQLIVNQQINLIRLLKEGPEFIKEQPEMASKNIVDISEQDSDYQTICQTSSLIMRENKPFTFISYKKKSRSYTFIVVLQDMSLLDW